MLRVSGDGKVVLRLADSEKAECQVAELKKPNFDGLVEHTMDYSQTASKGIPDMVDIDELNHATLMHNLQVRYSKDEIYTYVGPIILAMNPFKSLDSKLYSPV